MSLLSSTPGFGWTAPKRGGVTVENGVEQIDGKTDFPSNAMGEYACAQSSRVNLASKLEPSTYVTAVQSLLRRRSELDANLAEDLAELKETGKSNGKELRLSFMDIAPDQAFHLHAHPNLGECYILWVKLCTLCCVLCDV